MFSADVYGRVFPFALPKMSKINPVKCKEKTSKFWIKNRKFGQTSGLVKNINYGQKWSWIKKTNEQASIIDHHFNF